MPCNAIPPVLPNKVVKNLTKSFCKVAEDELHEKLAKKPKKKGHEEMAKVSKARGPTPTKNEDDMTQGHTSILIIHVYVEPFCLCNRSNKM